MNLLDKALDRPLLLVGSLVAVLIVLLGMVVQKFAPEIGLALVLAILIGIGVASRIPQRFAGGDIGFELCLFFTILVGLKHGFLLAGVVGSLSMGISGYVTKERPDDVGVAILGLLLIAGIVSVFGQVGSLVLTGVLYTLVYDVAVCGVYLVTGHAPFGCVKFAATHLVWNFVMFRSLGEVLLAIL